MRFDLKRNLMTGTFIWVPIALTAWVFLILLGIVNENLSIPIGRLLVGQDLSGFAASAIGIPILLIILYGTGLLGSHFLGRQLIDVTEELISHIPVFKSLYNAVKQMTTQLSSKETSSFRKVVLVRREPEGHWTLGFLTGEFPDPDGGKVPHFSVYIPTNHLWFGEVRIVSAGEVSDASLSVEEGVSYFLSCGVAVPEKKTSKS